MDAREKLGKELKDQQCAKEVMLLELATKTKQTVLLEQERDTHQRDLAEQGQRVRERNIRSYKFWIAHAPLLCAVEANARGV